MSKAERIDEAYRILRKMLIFRLEQMMSQLSDALDRLDKDIPAFSKIISDLETKSVSDDATIADQQKQIADLQSQLSGVQSTEDADAARINAQLDTLDGLVPSPAAVATENPPPADEAPPV